MSVIQLNLGTYNTADSLLEPATAEAAIASMEEARIDMCALPEAMSTRFGSDARSRLRAQFRDHNYNFYSVPNDDALERDDARETGLAVWRGLGKVAVEPFRMFDRNALRAQMGGLAFYAVHANDRLPAFRHGEMSVLAHKVAHDEAAVVAGDFNADTMPDNDKLTKFVHFLERMTVATPPAPIRLEGNGVSAGRIRNIIERLDGIVGDERTHQILREVGGLALAGAASTEPTVTRLRKVNLRIDGIYLKNATEANYRVHPSLPGGSDHRLVTAAVRSGTNHRGAPKNIRHS